MAVIYKCDRCHVQQKEDDNDKSLLPWYKEGTVLLCPVCHDAWLKVTIPALDAFLKHGEAAKEKKE